MESLLYKLPGDLLRYIDSFLTERKDQCAVRCSSKRLNVYLKNSRVKYFNINLDSQGAFVVDQKSSIIYPRNTAYATFCLMIAFKGYVPKNTNKGSITVIVAVSEEIALLKKKAKEIFGREVYKANACFSHLLVYDDNYSHRERITRILESNEAFEYNYVIMVPSSRVYGKTLAIDYELLIIDEHLHHGLYSLVENSLSYTGISTYYDNFYGKLYEICYFDSEKDLEVDYTVKNIGFSVNSHIIPGKKGSLCIMENYHHEILDILGRIHNTSKKVALFFHNKEIMEYYASILSYKVYDSLSIDKFNRTKGFAVIFLLSNTKIIRTIEFNEAIVLTYHDSPSENQAIKILELCNNRKAKVEFIAYSENIVLLLDYLAACYYSGCLPLKYNRALMRMASRTLNFLTKKYRKVTSADKAAIYDYSRRPETIYFWWKNKPSCLNDQEKKDLLGL